MFDLETEFKGYPNKDAQNYKEIESFETYELYNCIAYEALIRVPHIKKALIKFSKLYNMEKSKCCTYELKQKASRWHCRLGLANDGFDIEASIFYAKKRYNPTYQLTYNKLTSTPTKYQEDRYSGNIIRVLKMSNGSIRRRDTKTGLRKDTINWDEFGAAPIFNLAITSKRPIVKNPIRHKYFNALLNFNLPSDKFLEQAARMKEIFDDQEDKNKEENKETIDFLNESLPIENTNLKEVVVKLLAHSSHSNINDLLSAGDLATGGPLFFEELEKKTHNVSKFMAEAFYIYDSIKEVEKFNKKLKAEKNDLASLIKSLDLSDEEETLQDLENDYQKKEISENAALNFLYLQLKDPSAEKRGKAYTPKKDPNKKPPNSVQERLDYIRNLIENEEYKSLM